MELYCQGWACSLNSKFSWRLSCFYLFQTNPVNNTFINPSTNNNLDRTGNQVWTASFKTWRDYPQKSSPKSQGSWFSLLLPCLIKSKVSSTWLSFTMLSPTHFVYSLTLSFMPFIQTLDNDAHIDVQFDSKKCPACDELCFELP